MASSMRAVVFTRYGPPEVLEIREVDKPTPKDDEVLVRISATAVTRGDVRLRGADPPLVRLFTGLLRPKSPRVGSDLAGEVEAVGEEVTRFKEGDPVFGARAGANREYICVPQSGMLALKPINMTFVACEKVFHALVELTDTLIARQVETHDDRVEALEEIERQDLADLYRIAKDALHTSGYYGQCLGPSQARTIARVRQAVETEPEKLQ